VRKRSKKEEITVPASIDYLGTLRDFVIKHGQKNGFSDRVISTFKLSVDEAATNIIKHGYSEKKGSITLRVLAKNDCMIVSLIDQGKYFDPRHVKAPNLSQYVNIRKKGGLGIFIMRRLMDSLEYRKTEEGNELRMTKMRDEPKKKKIDIHVPSMSVTLKARYSLIMSAILTLIVLIGYLYYYFHWEIKIIEETLLEGKKVSESLATVVSNDVDLESGELDDFRVSKDVIQKKAEYSDIIQDITVVHLMGFTLYATSKDLFWESYKPPQDAIQIEKNIYSYNYRNEIPVYVIIEPVLNPQNVKLGYVHVLFKKQYALSKISKHRRDGLETALFILLFSYFGIVVIIYMVMSPFQKLAEWVRAFGHGDEVDEEMDITDSGEIGEIAKAFSDITSKFKKSQESLVRQEQLQKEMQVAQEIQQTLLPSEFPLLDGYEIGSFYEAAKEVGGDYFDFVEVDKDTLGIVVADVSGKGVPGSLVMTMIRTTLRTEARGLKVASEVLSKVNQFVVDDMKKGMFVTAFYVIIDSRRRRLNYTSAGHNPMILYRGSTQKTYYLNPRGFPIGISLPDDQLFKNSLESDTIQLIEDDILLIYTDGITEAMNSRREMFGEERLLKAIRDYGHLPVQQFVEKISDEIHSFTEGFPQNDDITLVVIKEETSAEKIELKRAKKAHKLIQSGKSIREACEQAGITTYAYYNKYKRKFEEEGTESYEIDDESISLEAKHLSIEEKTKIYDIIRRHPDYGAKRISEELDTEAYNYTKINETRIYDELVRSRLNTRKLREAFLAREKKGKPIKPPGTPLLTLDGQVIIDKSPASITLDKEEIKKGSSEKEISSKEDITTTLKPKHKKYAELTDAESFILNPLESVLNKELEATELISEEDVLSFADNNSEIEEVAEPSGKHDDEKEKLPKEKGQTPSSVAEYLTFEDLMNDESLYQDSENGSEAGLANEFTELKTDEKDEDGLEQKNAETELVEDEEINDEIGAHEQSDEEIQESTSDFEDSMPLSGVDDILKQEISWDFAQSIYENEDDFDEETITEEAIEEDTVPELNLKEEIESRAVSNNGNNDGTDSDNSLSDLLDEIEEEIASLDDEQQNSGTARKKKNDNKSLNDTSTSREEQIPISHKKKQELERQLLVQGLQYYQQRQYDAAIKELKNVLERYPEMKEARTILGNAYFRNRMLDKAAIEYKRVKAIDPSDVDACENMGAIYANTGDYEKAISEWEYILKIDPNRKDIKDNIKKVSKILSSK